MLVKTFGSALYGVEAVTITVEVNVGEGQHYFKDETAGSAIRECLQRIESAIRSGNFYMPQTNIGVRIAPAGIQQSVSGFELPIAIAILGASEQIENVELLRQYVLMGELGLDGTLLPLKGALPIAIRARKEGYKGLIVPKQNAREAAIVNNLNVFGVSHIKEVAGFFSGKTDLTAEVVNTREFFYDSQYDFDIDFSDVKGHDNSKRALEIAAAGGHNAVLIGPPGAEKKMLAKRLPTILPPLTLHEALETTMIHSVAAKLPADSSLISRPPFRAPHATIGDAALVGDGALLPGEISLAHKGVLFLDELPEFKCSVLDTMCRQMEGRRNVISSMGPGFEFPAGFLLLSAMNPCACGYYNHPQKQCTCSPGMVQKYLSRISASLLGHIDLHVEVVPFSLSELSYKTEAETSSVIRERVLRAREIQTKRYKDAPGIYFNAQMTTKMMQQYCVITKVGEVLLRRAMERLNLAACAYDKILKVSRTIADLEGCADIRPEFLAEAVQYRSLDRAERT
ncbi:MAG TPA: YifB family Mg chelatase-like AAA ATPase [Arachidicoccus sp.]